MSYNLLKKKKEREKKANTCCLCSAMHVFVCKPRCVCVCVRKDLHACVNSVNVRNPAAHPDVRRLMPSRELFWYFFVFLSIHLNLVSLVIFYFFLVLWKELRNSSVLHKHPPPHPPTNHHHHLMLFMSHRYTSNPGLMVCVINPCVFVLSSATFPG